MNKETDMDQIEPFDQAADIEADALMTVADIIARIGGDASLTQRQRRGRCSALRSVCRVLGADPSSVPAELRYLRERLAKLSPASGRLGKGRWTNIRSLVLAAFAQAGIPTMPGRATDPLTPAWEAMKALLDDRGTQIGLSRFISFC